MMSLNRGSPSLVLAFLASWLVATAPTLCIAGVLEHACECEGVAACGCDSDSASASASAECRSESEACASDCSSGSHQAGSERPTGPSKSCGDGCSHDDCENDPCQTSLSARTGTGVELDVHAVLADGSSCPALGLRVGDALASCRLVSPGYSALGPLGERKRIPFPVSDIPLLR